MVKNNTDCFVVAVDNQHDVVVVVGKQIGIAVVELLLELTDALGLMEVADFHKEMCWIGDALTACSDHSVLCHRNLVCPSLSTMSGPFYEPDHNVGQNHPYLWTHGCTPDTCRHLPRTVVPGKASRESDSPLDGVVACTVPQKNFYTMDNNPGYFLAFHIALKWNHQMNP